MKKQTLLSIFLAAVMMIAAGCTSKKVEGEGDEANELTESTDAGGDAASFEDEFGSDEVATEGGGDDFGSDDFSEDSAGGEFADGGEAAPADPAMEGAADDLAALEEDFGSGTEEPLDAGDTGDAGLDPGMDSGDSMETADSGFSNDELAGLSDSSQSMDDTSYGTMDDSGYSEPVSTGIPLRKMMTVPYTKNGVLVNTIYIARDGDTLESVAQKVYGMDRSDELRSVNGHLANRDVKVGDKIYYNSPNRPTDNSQLITYYEDLGLQPEFYPAQAGDNIRAVSQRLLGHENSWKEIWATNMDVESKDVLAMDTNLRYWPGGSAPAPMAQATVANPPPPPMNEPQFEQPPPLPEEVAQAAPPPPEFEQVPPPAIEPPAPEIAPPPIVDQRPPTPVAATSAAEEGTGSLLDDPDQTMALAAGIILLTAALALIIIIRKKRRNRGGIDFHTATHTQIE